METLHVSQGMFRLARYPAVKRDPLRAWDAADEYLLQHIADTGLPGENGRVLVVNDSFGALSMALANAHSVVMQSDSYLAHCGLRENLRRNGHAAEHVGLLQSLDVPVGPFTTIVLKIPKSHALLEDQLYRLRPLLAEGAILVAAAMARAIHRSTLHLFERVIGPAPTSLARKKARLVLPQYSETLHPGTSPWPRRFALEGTDLHILNHANVFSREKLDIGTRFFIGHLPRRDEPVDVIDLGCGNGIVGVMMKRANPRARLTFTDESFMALASARSNWETAFPDESARFVADDCMRSEAAASAELVLINPPFHQQNTITSQIARRMFREAWRVLRPGGECRIIGNRHLGYHRDLKRQFGRCETVAANPKFVVLSAVK